MLARPVLSVLVAAGALLAIAAPAVGMKTQNLTLDQEFGDSLPIVQTYNRVAWTSSPGRTTSSPTASVPDVSWAPTPTGCTPWTRCR
ncbi:hypothetical protein SGLAM104S_08440 [Streptomyces glaucescens]